MRDSAESKVTPIPNVRYNFSLEHKTEITNFDWNVDVRNDYYEPPTQINLTYSADSESSHVSTKKNKQTNKQPNQILRNRLFQMYTEILPQDESKTKNQYVNGNIMKNQKKESSEKIANCDFTTRIHFKFPEERAEKETCDGENSNCDNNNINLSASTSAEYYEEPCEKHGTVMDLSPIAQKHYERYYKCCYNALFCTMFGWFVTVVIMIICYNLKM